MVLEILEGLNCWLVKEIEALFWFSTSIVMSAFICEISAYQAVNDLRVNPSLLAMPVQVPSLKNGDNLHRWVVPCIAFLELDTSVA
jgi:hypothetical protein